MTATATPTVRPIPEFEGVHDVWPRGGRLEAVREAAARYRDRFLAQGTIRAIRSIDIAAAPYPSRYAFQGYNLSLNPMISIINRMFVIQFEGFDGELKTLVWEPTVAAGSAEAPFYAKLQRLAGDFLADKVFAKYYNDPDEVLPRLGLRNSDVDYVSFDHLHVQDVRMIMGSERVIPGEREPRAPLFPGAKLLVHRKELATLESPHPMQWAWYVDGGMDGVPAERLEVLDGDVELGVGVSLLWTPGHTDGNHSLVVNTPDGVWVSSENGMAADSWQPELSKIPGVKQQARFFNREVVLNANTLEDSLDQYDSMVKEKTMASRSSRDARWLQIIPSSECADWKRQWPVVPTFTHGGLDYGEISTRRA
ncbi:MULTISPECIES: hypothetical protein [unclassified Saccharopolyspora]|uniref:hypothetical protein n=1 Tax=unclassified Saccharopolyspora TaxID=2646250 RepID=UPI001CD35E7A|nr:MULTISPECIES: hypothetical protein [unclassified Saccharopolyspora]MCA1187545.1 hypothetical protein [Saccharopolyspora sp. 6T]MCA1279770.1 hypothetical protein [Saccharopolyspora sp. 7B]